MKISIGLLGLFLLTINFQLAHAQESVPATVELKAGPAGGNYYDVAQGTSLTNKYGPEDIPSTGEAVQFVFNSTEQGRLSIRAIHAQDHAGNPLENQFLIEYDSPKLKTIQTKIGDVFVGLRADDIYQNGHLIFFNANLQDHIRINQNSASAAPVIGYSKELKKDFNSELSLQGGAELGLRPIEFKVSDSHLTENAATEPLPFNPNENISTLGFGGKIKVFGVLQYRNKYYLRIQFEQDASLAYSNAQVTESKRALSAELNYQVSPKLTAKLGAENTEVDVSQNSRLSIGVNNFVYGGVAYRLVKKKKSRPLIQD